MRKLAAVTLALLSLLTAASAQDNLAAWLDFDFARQTIKPSQFSGLPADNLKTLRGILFGRHGRIFKDADIKGYLENQPWYKPNPDFKNSMLNDIERKNLDLIRDEEARQHPSIQPGDMRFYRSRLITPKKWGQHSGAEWTVLAAEI